VKLLLDQNLSPRLVSLLAGLYPGSTHVRLLGLDTASEVKFGAMPRSMGYTIVSKDADFHQRSFVLGAPPKVIWIRLGNCSVADTEILLRDRFSAVQRSHDDAGAAFRALS
jgi:predicted nuclease of predicted toxin-antitoxin system